MTHSPQLGDVQSPCFFHNTSYPCFRFIMHNGGGMNHLQRQLQLFKCVLTMFHVILISNSTSYCKISTKAKHKHCVFHLTFITFLSHLFDIKQLVSVHPTDTQTTSLHRRPNTLEAFILFVIKVQLSYRIPPI